MDHNLLAWLPVFVLFAPLTGAVLLLSFRKKWACCADWIAIALMASCLIGSFRIYQEFSAPPAHTEAHAVAEAPVFQSNTFTWMSVGSQAAAKSSLATTPFTLEMGIHLDSMGALMLLIVCGLGTLVLVFNSWYLHDDPLHASFPWKFLFFCFAMCGVVLSDNLLMTFIFWELVGLGSYFLIGFWYDKPAVSEDPFYQKMKAPDATGVIETRLSPSHAQLKAFIMNRVGDFGFICGIILIGWVVLNAHAAHGTSATHLFRWDHIFNAAQTGAFNSVSFMGLSGGSLLTLAGIGIFLGAMGKSAQFPLHTWLPDAMQGPTTASAIIHAATMVAAGVFLTARVYPLLTPDTLLFISWVGGITCFFAATCATVQWDLKAVLAYSTISQLGFMMLGLGAGLENHGLAAGISHLFTHAMFKCMLFLCAAAVIHACHHHQDMGKLGGLKAKMPLTAAAMGVGVLAIAGVPGFSGFYSKDSVLSAAYLAGGERQEAGGCMVLSWVPFFLGLITAGLTAYYMTRLWVRLFTGTPKDSHIQEHAHDPWPRAKVVLIILALFSLQAVWTRELNPFSSEAWLDTLLQPGPHSEADHARFHEAHTLIALCATFMLILGASAAALVYWYYPERMKTDAATQLKTRWPFTWLHPLFSQLWYIEYLYDQVFTEGLGLGVGRVLAVLDLGTPERLKALEPGKSAQKPSAFSVDGLIDGVGRALAWVGRGANRMQSGRTSDYAAWAGLMAALLLMYLILW